MTRNYSASDVRVIEEVEHIRMNPGMYVGDTNTPTHLIEEALDNALDEALAGYAKVIAVLIDTKNHKYSVLDDGRGIPISDNTPVVISSKLFSGAKFQDKKTAYEISSGLHGVGLVAVNALSSEYNVEVYRNNQKAIYNFKSTKLKHSKVEKFTGEKPFSTKIEFSPDKKFFETLKPELKRIRQRLTIASAEIKNDVKLVLIVDGEKEIFALDEVTHFMNESIVGSKDIPIIDLCSVKKPERMRVLLAYDTDGPIGQKYLSSVNLLPVEQGGVHVNYFFDLVREFFSAQAKKFGYKFQPNDALYRLRSYLMMSLVEPKFSGQTKDRLTNRRADLDHFIKDLRQQLISWASKNEEALKDQLATFQEHRRRIDAKKITTNGTGGKRVSTQFTKLRDCTNRTGELFIVEGDSAGGSIIQSRDPHNHAILPLRGKSIPNVTTKKNILANKEVGELVKAIGCGVDPEFDISKMRYSKIICATDADHDGNHIACLVSMVIAILMPDVIKEGRYFIAQTPLFAITEKKLFTPLWTEKELEKARKANKNITRFKGLGELTPAQLKISLLDEGTRKLIPLTYSSNMEDLVKLFSSAEEKRKLVVS